MINLRNSPFLWFALLLLLAYGISQATEIRLTPLSGLILMTICIVSGILCIRKYNPGFQFVSTISISVLIVSAGMLKSIHFKSSIYPAPHIDSSIRMQGMLIVTEVLKAKENSITLRCTPSTLYETESDNPRTYTDKFILAQLRDFNGEPVFPGDTVTTSGWVSAMSAPLNPYAFDIRKYYRTLGIRHQLSCKGPETIITSATSNSLFRITAKWQARLSNMVSEHTSADVAQLTNALVWGDRSDMNEEIRDAFADSGAMHVLSVSGMHMAMIYSMLYLLLGAPGSGTYSRRLIRLGCYSVTIILYMGLTGACPAVVRSGLMIILFLCGKAMGWNTQIWNLLGFAAFLMLWSNPFLYQNIGFQLSFLAMAGILMYAQPMIRSLSFRQILLHRIWEITAVSIAAQVFILPILLKQFHQFPLTFIASSLVAMPASYVIIFGSILNIILSCFGLHFLWPWFDKAGHYFILSMKWMAGLNPLMNYSLTPTGSLLLMTMAIIFSIALVYHWKNGKRIAYVFGLSVLVTLGWHRTHQWKTDDLVIYHHFKGLIADIFIGGQCFSIQDCSLTNNSIEFSARGYRCYRDVIHTTVYCKEDEFNTEKFNYISSIIHLPATSILIWDSLINPLTIKYPVSYILVGNCSNQKTLKDFICLHLESLIILPSHLDRRTKNGLIRFFENNDIPYYDIGKQGYFRLPL
jgi:competence protein ComEC